MPTLTNLLADIPENLPEELFQAILDKPNLRIERIVSLGHASPQGYWHDEEHNEFVVLLQGAAWLKFEGDKRAIEMTTGSFVDIPAHKRHRVEWTDPNQPTIWLAIRYG